MIKMALTPKEMAHKSYQNKRDKGLCPRCSKPLDRIGFYCSECLLKERERGRENREFYRANHLCTACGKERVYGDDKTCFECRAKKEISRKPPTEEQKIRYRESFKKQQKMLYAERKEKGICVKCGKRKTMPGRVRCAICLNKDAKTHRKSDIARSEWADYGYCFQCGAKELYKGFKVCKKCYDRICKMTEGNGGNNDYWKGQNKLIGKEI